MADRPQHRLRLLLSVDMVGSTAFKQGQEAHAHSWPPAFQLFYSQVPKAFNRELAKLTGVLLGPQPSFWKGVGDELLFAKELTDYREALWTIHAWRQAIQASRSVISQAYPPLDLKSTAWLANFPITNAEINLPNGAVDFVGPSVDVGFRLAALASPTRLVLSMGLAWLLAEALQDGAGEDCGRWTFHYDGPTALKGILGGGPYPVFSLDVRVVTDKSSAEDRLGGRVDAALADIIVVCRDTIAEKPTHLFAPYIDPEVNPNNLKFRTIPEPVALAMAALRAG